MKTLLAKREVADIGVVDTDTLVAAINQRPGCRPMDVIESMLTQRAVEAGKSIWVEKTPRHVFHLRRTADAMPGSRFVVLVRDPRDVSLSVRTAWSDGNTFKHFLQWQRAIARAEAQMRRNPGSVMFVRYEDLIRTPSDVLKSVCAFFQISFSEHMASYYEKVPSTIVLDREPWKHKNLRPIDPNNAGRWRQSMDTSEVHLARLMLYRSLLAFGYEVGSPMKVRALPRSLAKLTALLIRESATTATRRYSRAVRTITGPRSLDEP